MNMAIPIVTAGHLRLGSNSPLPSEVDQYTPVQTDEGRLTTFEDWVAAARLGHFGYRFVLGNEACIRTNDLDAIVSACGDVPSGP